MFRKLVTNLPYSPGLLNQVGFYTKRLKQEEFARRMGMIFAVLALLVNINLSIFSPEASVLASPGNDVVTGGIGGKNAKTIQDHAINAMQNSAYTKAIYDYYGITESDIRNTKIDKIKTSDDSLRSVGRQAFGRGAEECNTHNGYSFCERSMYAAYGYRSLSVRAITGTRSGRTNTGDSWFSLVESCGNVVVRISQNEDISINKTLSPNQATTVEPGDNVEFRIKIRSNNENGALFPVITDTLPKHTSYVNHAPKDLFDKVKLKNQKVELYGTDKLNGLGPNEERVVTIIAKVKASAPSGAQLCNKVAASSLYDSAVGTNKPCVTVKVVDPVPACRSLRMLGSGGSNTVRTFEAKTNADGAKISSYFFSFGDGTSDTVDTSKSSVTLNHTYTPGTYSAKVLVTTDFGNVGNSGSCKLKLTVDEPTPDPSVTCDYIKQLSGFGTEKTITFEASASPENGASVSGFKISYGDESSETVASNSTNKIEVSHAYDEAGDYTIRLTADTSLGDITNNESCRTSVSIDEEPERCKYDPAILKTSEECVKPAVCQYNQALDPDDPECGEANIFRLKQVENVTQNIDDAHGTTANAGDTIRFTLVTENDGTASEVGYVIKDDLADVLQYSTLIDADGGVSSDNGLVVTWPKVDIAPGQVVERTITVKIKSPIPDTPVSASDPLAFDLRLENAYGNNVTIELPESLPKQVEGIVTTLPKTGAGLNSLVSTLFIGVVSYFYFRNRLVSKELHMIKNEFSGGAL